MSASMEAAMAQTGSGKNYGVDVWWDVEVPAMTKLWQGIGGHSNFFISECDVRNLTGSYVGDVPLKFAETFWRLAQVGPSPRRGYRLAIQEFVVDLRCQAALSVCDANMKFGGGTAIQYYIPNWEQYLLETGRSHQFEKQSYADL